jgi:hypothetical protein
LKLDGKAMEKREETVIDNMALLSPPKKKLRYDSEENVPLPSASDLLCVSPSKKHPSNQPLGSLKGILRYKIKPPSLKTVMAETIILPMDCPFFSNPEDSSRYIKPAQRYRERDGPARVIASEVKPFDPPVSRSFQLIHLNQNRWKIDSKRPVFHVDSSLHKSSIWLEYLYPPPKHDDVPRKQMKISKKKNFSQVLRTCIESFSLWMCVRSIYLLPRTLTLIDFC